MRLAASVLAGYALWTVLWLSGGAALQAVWPEELVLPESGEPLPDSLALLLLIGLSGVASLASGRLAAGLARDKQRAALWILGGFLLVTGIGVQAGIWSRMPVWYHLVFLALLVPLTLAGGRLGQARPAGA